MELPQLGETFQSKYRLDEVLGEGGFARVYQAVDVGAQRTVALKILKPFENGYARDVESRFNREVKVVARLRDPHTVTMFDFGRSSQGLLFMVFEFVPGQDLTQLLKRGPMGDDATIHILRQVLQSLREAHQEGLLHRDLKPANIRVYEYMGDPLRVSLLDFGIAKPVMPSSEGSAITHSGSLVGTPQYMSPEQLLEQPLTPASDIYSLGLVAYEMITGVSAIKGNTLSDQLHVLASPTGIRLPPDARVSPGLRRIIDRMISRDPATRLQTAEHVLRSLEALARGESTAEVSLQEAAAAHRPITGSQPLQSRPGSQPLLPPPGSQPMRPPSGSSPLMAPPPHEWSSDSMERRPPSTEQSLPGFSAAPPPSDDNVFSTRQLIGLLGLVVVTIVIVGAAVLKQASTPPPNAQPTLPPSHRSAAAPTPVEPAKPAPIDPPPVVEEPEATKSGCGKRAPFKGLGSINAFGMGGGVTTYVPTSYDPAKTHPLLVVFHDADQAPENAFSRLKLKKFADDEGMVVMLPGDDPFGPWQAVAGVIMAHGQAAEVREQLCIDETRIYGFGHGAGGRAAARMPCHFPGVTAVATTSFRPPRGEEVCLQSPPVPQLHIATLRDRASPPKGGVGECGGPPITSITEYENKLLRHHQCKGKESPWRGNNRCVTWKCEDAPLVSCRVDGGREWRSAGPRQANSLAAIAMGTQCDGAPANFPFLKTIGEFFQREAPGVRTE